MRANRGSPFLSHRPTTSTAQRTTHTTVLVLTTSTQMPHTEQVQSGAHEEQLNYILLLTILINGPSQNKPSYTTAPPPQLFPTCQQKVSDSHNTSSGFSALCLSRPLFSVFSHNLSAPGEKTRNAVVSTSCGATPPVSLVQN